MDDAGRADRPLRVFLSHTREVADYPTSRSFVAAARDAVARAGHVVVDPGTASTPPTAEVCRRRVEDCDVHVAIVGFRYGEPVTDDPGRSRHELELDTATDLQRPRFVFLVSERTVDVPRDFWVNDHPKRQAAFRTRVAAEGLVRAEVSSPAELESALYRALAEPAISGKDVGLGQIVVDGVPQRPAGLVERGQVEELTETLRRTDGHAAVVHAADRGAGVGTSQVAAELARRRVEEGCPLVIWVSGGTEVTVLAGLAEAATAVGVGDPHGDSAVSARRLREALQSRSQAALMVVDGVDIPMARLQPYLPTTGPCEVVLTGSPDALEDFGALVEVHGYGREQAVGYLERRTGRGDPAGAAAVAAELDDLALPLAQAAATLTERTTLSYSGYLYWLARRLPDRWPAERGGDYPKTTAAATLLLLDCAAVRRVPGTENVLNLLAFLGPDGISVSMLRRMDLERSDDLDEVLAALAGLSLATVAGEGTTARIVAHGLVARVVRERDELSGTLTGALAAALDALWPLVEPEGTPSSDRRRLAEAARHAEALWRHAVAAADREAVTSDDAAPVANLAAAAVWHLARAGDGALAVALGRPLAAQCRRILGADHPDTRTAQNNLALAYETAGRQSEAVGLYRAVRDDCERLLGADHPDTLHAQDNLAGAYDSAGRFDQALDLYRTVAAARERISGADHPDTLTARDNLALIHESAGRLDEAIEGYRAVLTARERVLGPDHPDTVNSQNNLALAYQEAGRLDQAIELYQITIAAHERVLGPDHPDTLTSRNNLALAYQGVGRLDQAIDAHRAVLSARKRVLGADHPATLTSQNNLAGAFSAAGRLDQALHLHRATVTARTQVLGADHPDTLASQNNLAGAYLSAGRLDQAIQLYRATVAASERVLGADHPNTLTSQNNLANACQTAGRGHEAVRLYQATLDRCRRVLGEDHPLTHTVADNLEEARRG